MMSSEESIAQNTDEDPQTSGDRESEIAQPKKVHNRLIGHA